MKQYAIIGLSRKIQISMCLQEPNFTVSERQNSLLKQFYSYLQPPFFFYKPINPATWPQLPNPINYGQNKLSRLLSTSAG